MRIGIAVAAILAVFFGQAPPIESQDPIAQLDDAQRRIDADLVHLCAAPRPVGSDALDRALEYTHRQLANAGARVWRENVQITRWSARVSLSTEQGPIPSSRVEALARSASTATLEATAIDVGYALPSDLDDHPDLADKIAIVRHGHPPNTRLHRVEKVQRLAYAGAIAAIFWGTTPRPVQGAVAITGTATLPVLSVAATAAEVNAWDGSVLQLSVEALPQTVGSANVWAEFAATSDAEGFLVAAAHLDSWDRGDGALDNAAGVAVILEVARQLAAQPADRTVRLVAFTGEEMGFEGALAHLEAESEPLPRAFLQLEQPEAPAGFVVHSGSALIPRLQTVVLAERGLGLQGGVQQKLLPYGDHVPFLLAGVPTYGLTYHRSADANARVHQDADQLQWLDAAGLARSAWLAAASLRALGSAHAPPIAPLEPAQVRRLFEAAGQPLPQLPTPGP